MDRDYPQMIVPAGHIEPAPRRVRALLGSHVVLDTTRAVYMWESQISRPGVARVYTEESMDGLAGMARFDWDALDAWFEEDEQVFVHPRSPYVRVDALRSTRSVRIELDGVALAESSSPVMVFETGLPTRYYLNRTDVNFEHLVPTDTVTACPYKGKTSGYWSVRAGGETHPDLAWAYDFPTRQLLPIAGLIAFYNEKVDVIIDTGLLPRPSTHFFT